jgi:hypothetical protein
VVVAPVLTVIVELTADVPVTLTLPGASKQPGVPVAPAGLAVTAQASPIEPVNPLLGVAVIVDVPESPGAAIDTPVPASAKLGGTTAGAIVTVTWAVCVMLPDLPVTMTVYVPAVVVVLVVTVIVELTAVVPVTLTLPGASEQPGVPVAPEGLDVTAQVSGMLPVKPLLGVAVIVDVPESPGAAIDTPVPASAKLGGTTSGAIVTVTWAVCVMLPDLPVTVTV